MANKRSPTKRRPAPKTVLRLPDLDQAKSAVLNSLSSRDAQRGYRHAMDEFIEWYCSEPRLWPAPAVFVDVRLDVEAQPREEISAADFALGAEVTRLMALLDKVENGKITRIDVRAGLPRRATFEGRHAEEDRTT